MIADGWFLLGAPWDCSGTGRGERFAPAALRAAGLSTLVGYDAHDVDIAFEGVHRDAETGVLGLAESSRAAHVLADTLTARMRELPDRRPLVVGGDCSILFGIVPALHRSVGRTGLWFVDGHPDYLDGSASDTGETADMDLAVLTGVGAEPLVSLAGITPMVAIADVALLGHRANGLDPASAAEVARLPDGLRRIDADAVRNDPAAAGREAVTWLAESGAGAWLHVDLDVLDPSALPAVSYPQPGGPDWAELAQLLAPLARSPRLLGVSVADFRPDLDPTGALAARIVDLLDRTLP